MTIYSASKGFVALSLSLEEDGRPHRVSFLGPAGELGPLSSATIYPSPLLAALEVEWVAVADIASTLAALFHTQAELSALDDFRQLQTDQSGMPCPFRYQLRCDSCGHGWQRNTAERIARFNCPRCRSRLDVQPWRAEWVGPAAPSLRALWARSPGPAGRRIEHDNGLVLCLDRTGLCVHSRAGHWLWVVASASGTVVEFWHAGKAEPMLVALERAGIFAHTTGGEVIEC